MAWDRNGGDKRYNNGEKEKLEFVSLHAFTPFMKGEKNRVFFELSKVINHTSNREFVFIKLTEQYRAQTGEWKYTGKNPSIRLEMLDDLEKAIKEVNDYIRNTKNQSGRGAQAGPHDDGGLGDKLKGKAPAAAPPTQADLFGGFEEDPF